MRNVTLNAVLIVLLLARSATSAAAEPAAPTQEEIAKTMCEVTVCQHNVRVNVRKRDGSTFDKTFDVLPGIVQQGGITLMPGQSVNVEARISGEQIELLRAVDVVTDPSKTITAKFEQAADGGMVLTTTSPFPQPIKFDMGIMSLDSDDLVKTSSCPIVKGSYEMWPYPLFLVFLGNPHLVAEDATRCD